MSPPDHFCQMLHERKDVRDFLHKLYSVNPKGGARKRRALLEAATGPQLQALIYVLFYICKKKIPVKAGQAQRILKSKGGPFLKKTFGSAESVGKLVNGSRRAKLENLNRISCYYSLLFLLFNKKKKQKTVSN